MQLFLVKLFKHKKLAFFIIASFFAIQFFINLKQGIVATPFLHYGMYSGVIAKPTSFDALEIEVNGKLLNLNNFLPETNDQLITPVNRYFSLDANRTNLYFSHVHPIFSKLKIPHSSSNFIYLVNIEKFTTWYKERLELLLDIHVNEFKVYKTTFKIQEKQFIKVKSNLVLHGING